MNLNQRPEVVHALHATAHPGSWVECRSSVHQAFHEKDLDSSISVLPRVLSKIPTLLFVGDQDLICNYIGIENMINALSWNGGTGLGVCILCFPFRFQLDLTVSIRLYRHNRGMSTRYLQVHG